MSWASARSASDDSSFCTFFLRMVAAFSTATSLRSSFSAASADHCRVFQHQIYHKKQRKTVQNIIFSTKTQRQTVQKRCKNQC